MKRYFFSFLFCFFFEGIMKEMAFSELNQDDIVLKLWQVREGAGDDAKCDEK